MADQNPQNQQAGQAKTVELSFVEMLAIIPPAIKDYLLSDETSAKRKAVYDQSSLSSEQRDGALAVEMDVFMGQLPVLLFPDALFTELGWPEEKEPEAALVAARIMGRLMLPASAYLGDVAGVIDALGFDHKEFPQEKITFRMIPYADATEEILKRSGVAFQGPTRDRAMKVIDSFVRGVRVEGELRDALTKATKVGGPGLSPEDAGKIIAAASALAQEAAFVEQVEAPRAASVPAAAPAEPAEKVWSKADIQAAYAGTPEEQATLAAKRDALRADGDKNVLAKFADEIIAEGRERSDAMMIVSGALMLAEAGVLMKSLKEPRIRQAFREHLEVISAYDALAVLDRDPEETALFAPYLLFLLKVKTDLSENDAARFALKIGNAFRKSGAKDVAVNAAFDPEKGEFVWESAA